MIEEQAVVVEIGEGCAWVETRRQASCGSCSAAHGCGTAVLAKVLGPRRSRLRVLNDRPLRVGDEVVIGIGEGALVGGSLMVYMTPLLFMFIGAVLGEVVVSRGEGMTVVAGLTGLLAGLLWLRLFGRRIGTDHRFQPAVLRCIAR